MHRVPLAWKRSAAGRQVGVPLLRSYGDCCHASPKNRPNPSPISRWNGDHPVRPRIHVTSLTSVRGDRPESRLYRAHPFT